MKAVVYAGTGEVRVDDVPEPSLQEPGDAIVDVSLTAICGSDLHLLDGKTPGMRVGGVIGHEFVGVVRDAGEGAADLRGRRVLGSFLIVCGGCEACRRGRFNHCAGRRALGLGALTGDLDGAQAESVLVPDAHVNLKALDAHGRLADEAALFCGDVLATGFHAAALAGAGPGERCVVVGAGPVGLFCALACRRAGAEVVVLDAEPSRVSYARDRYGLEAVDVSGGDAASAVAERTDGLMADVAIDAVGAVEALKGAMKCVRDGGRVVVVGVYGAERYELPLGRAWVRALDLRFSGMANVQGHWHDALRAVASGELDPTRVITHRLALDDAVEGYELFRSRRALKVVMRP